MMVMDHTVVILIYFVCMFDFLSPVPGFEPRAMDMPSNCSTTELHPGPAL